MKKLIIIGAGGMGRTVYDLARQSVGYGVDFEVKGFVDDNIKALDTYDSYPAVLSTIKDYELEIGDVFVSSIGSSNRKTYIRPIVDKGGEFINIIHSTARLGTNVKLGKGNIIGAYATVGADARVGDYNMIQSYSVIGHDAEIGNNNRIDTHVVCVGGVKVCDDVNIYTSSVINHGVEIEDGACVAALSFVIRRVKAGTTVHGNPAKKFNV